MIASVFARILTLALTLLFFTLPAAAQETRVAPANDNFASATAVSSRATMNGFFTVTTAQDGTIQAGEPVPSCAVSNIFDSVWYEFTAPYEIELIVDTFESVLTTGSGNIGKDTVLGLYYTTVANPTFANLIEAGCAQNSTGAANFTWYRVPARRYFLQVASEVALSGASTYTVDFGSRYQLLANTHFGETTPVLAPWTVTNPNGDKVVCVELRADNCHFRFKTSATENSILKYVMNGLAELPHNTGPTNYSEFLLQADYTTERALTNATIIIEVTFSNGTKVKDSRMLDSIGAVYVDPLSGTTPIKAVVKIKHKGKVGKPLYILNVDLYYAPGATGRDTGGDILPMPPPSN